MKKRDYSPLNPLQLINWELLLSGIDLDYDLQLQQGRYLDAFYQELGWDAETQAKFFFGTVCVEMLSKDELLMLLDQEIYAFVKKCHPLLLALLNSLRNGGADV